MTNHDATYHQLFSHPGMVADLLRHFLEPEVVALLQLERMERVSALFHAEGDSKREGDLIWRIPTRDGSEIYLYLLLEFQSTIDPWMAVRVMVYAGLLWQYLIREKRLAPEALLPPVLPVVLYNGEPPWTAPVDLAERIALPSRSPLWPLQPRMRYYLMDEGRIPGTENRASLSALLFRLEHCRDAGALLGMMDELIGWFENHPDFAALKRIMAGFMARTDMALGGPDPGLALPEDLLEVKNMLAARVQSWKQELLDQGRLEGRLAGRQEGRLEGEAQLLSRLLSRRFGPLPEWVAGRLQGADDRLLELWSDRLLSANSLEAVFSD